ncbi:MAG: NAD(P)H-dependent flavin oxidoreductase [Bacteroidota bacterium]
MKNRITELFQIKFPIIQAGMIWCSGWRLAAAVSNAGGLGIIGAGSMYPDVLREHIRKCKEVTSNNFAVNLPLLYPNIDEHIQIIIEEKVPIVFTSAGNPATWTSLLKSHGIIVVHVIANTKFALKAESAGVDAIVAEGFEAGGHNGREETTTLCLIPLIKDTVKIPIIAAGGIADGRAMLACFALGAEGVQVGTRFVASDESSANEVFKNKVVNMNEGDTSLTLKSLTPVRLIKNEFYQKIEEAQSRGASKDELKEILGRARAKKGMFEGDMLEGELEIGQVAANFKKIKPAAEILNDMWNEFVNEKKKIEELRIA